ncbi:MAG TPA: thioesterase family protein [Pseudidiomarina sp.]|nr:thioesterase family protein [Pseudidiomarina sp.]
MQFTDILAMITPAAIQKIDLPSGWGQGRAIFGGLTAGIAWQHAHHGAAKEQELRALTISFVAPVQPGPAELQRRILREGKNVTQIAVEIIQEDEVVLAALATYGRSRESVISITDMPAPTIPPKEQGTAFPNHPLIPEFTHFYDYRVSVGGLPFSGTASRSFGGWMRYRNEQQPISIGTFLGLVDAWPPALLQRLNQPAPASSLTWTIEFPAALPAHTTQDWWQYEAYIDHAADGYGHTHAHIWDQSGQLVAISRQTVTVFG